MSETTSYFFGSAENKLNSKGQVAIPARIRSALPEDVRSFVLTLGEVQCLYMYTLSQFAVVKDRAKEFAEKENDAGFYRSFMAEAYGVDLDTQGRFVLPQHFLRAAGIVGQGVLFVGLNNRVEIWEPSLFEKNRGDAEKYELLRKKGARSIFGI